MIRNSMLYYRKTKPRTAGFLGVTFVHAIKSFKYAFLLILRNTYSAVPDGYIGIFLIRAYIYIRNTALIIVFNRIVAQIVYYLIKHTFQTVYEYMLAHKLHIDILCLACSLKHTLNLTCKLEKVNLLTWHLSALIKL